MNQLDIYALNLPLAEHPLSKELVEACNANGYATLLDLFTIPIKELEKNDWFSEPYKQEFVTMIKKLQGKQ